MSRTPRQILAEWLTLLPPGTAWARRSGTNLAGLLMAGAIARAQLEADIEALELEISPKTATLLLSDYEAVLGPDPFGRDIGVLTTEQWQTLLYGRWVSRGGQSIGYYVALAAALGFSISISEPEPAIYGDFVYGDGTVYSTEADYFLWVVTLPALDTGLETIFRALRQPDTEILFLYVAASGGFGRYDFTNIPFGA